MRAFPSKIPVIPKAKSFEIRPYGKGGKLN